MLYVYKTKNLVTLLSAQLESMITQNAIKGHHRSSRLDWKWPTVASRRHRCPGIVLNGLAERVPLGGGCVMSLLWCDGCSALWLTAELRNTEKERGREQEEERDNLMFYSIFHSRTAKQQLPMSRWRVQQRDAWGSLVMDWKTHCNYQDNSGLASPEGILGWINFIINWVRLISATRDSIWTYDCHYLGLGLGWTLPAPLCFY